MPSSNGFIDWQQVPFQTLAPGVRTRTPHGERIMLSLIEFEPGGIVPPHRHMHEQAGIVLEGKLRLTMGGETRVIGAGDSYIIPSNAMHSAQAVDGPARALDIFSPIREDYAARTNTVFSFQTTSGEPRPAVGETES